MIERGGGRTSGQTDWHLMDLNSMWACLQDHDTTNHWKQVAGWRKVCDLAQIHLGRLQEYRRGLAEAWPPETSAASGTYLSQLDDLIAKVRHTHDAAAANYTALSAATQAIGTTRAELRKLHEEYAVKLKQKQAYEATVADPKAIMGNRVVDAPVTDGELERLNVQARAMMFNLSGELQQAQATLRQPPPRPAPRVDDNVVTPAGDSAPTIPPIVPVPMVGPNPSPVPQRTSTDSQTGRVAISTGVGPILGGTSTGTTAPIPDLARTPQGPVNTTPVVGLPPVLGPISGSGSSRSQPATGVPRPISGSIPGSAKGNNAPATSRPLPPGGLIGGAPGLGLGQPGASSIPPRRVNPVGGVIGGGGAGTAPAGGAGSRPGARRGTGGINNMPPFGGVPSNGAGLRTGSTPNRTERQTSDDANAEPRRWDPDQPWETEQGVAPIVLPPENDGPINPGPAIGFSR